MEFVLIIEEKEEKFLLDEKDGLWTARFGDAAIEAELVPAGPNTFRMTVSGKSFTVYLAENEGKQYVSIGGRQYCIAKGTGVTRRRSSARGSLKVEEVVASPMPGLVVKVSVSDGDVVKAEQVLVVVESMKMENNIRAHGEARVKKVCVKAGDSVNFGSPLVELEPVSA